MITYVGDAIRFKILANQMCNYFGLELNHKKESNDDDLVYSFFWDIKGRLIGPNTHNATLWNDKIYQYQELKDFVPIPDFKVYDGVIPLMLDLRKIDKKFFITEQNGIGGKGSSIYNGKVEDVMGFKGAKRLRVSEYIPHLYDVSCHLVILNDKKFFISYLSEQIIEGTSFRGCRFPPKLNKKVIEKTREYCSIIAERLYRTGYTGICGVQFMICENNDVYLCELNPRKMGSTPFVSMQMEIDCGVPLSAMEYYVILGEIPEVKYKKIDIAWEVNYSEYNEYPLFDENPHYFTKKGEVTYKHNENYPNDYSYTIRKWDL